MSNTFVNWTKTQVATHNARVAWFKTQTKSPKVLMELSQLSIKCTNEEIESQKYKTAFLNKTKALKGDGE